MRTRHVDLLRCYVFFFLPLVSFLMMLYSCLLSRRSVRPFGTACCRLVHRVAVGQDGGGRAADDALQRAALPVQVPRVSQPASASPGHTGQSRDVFSQRKQPGSVTFPFLYTSDGLRRHVIRCSLSCHPPWPSISISTSNGANGSTHDLMS